MSNMDTSDASAMANFRKRWELENNVQEMDSIFKYNKDEQTSLRAMKPWEKDPNYFKEVKMSALALLKMVIHAQSGGNLEIMGLVQGRIEANTLIIIDSFALPVEGTETRVNAQAQAYEYMTNYAESCEAVARVEKVVGWYHSHPGYGCWLSGIDVSTQTLNQQFQEPFVAIVIDPIRTITAGKVDIGAFRTYPKGYKPPDEGPQEYQSIPLHKVEDFGVHCKNYYSLNISYFKSSLDTAILNAMWTTYWKNTLTVNPLRTNAEYLTSQIMDLGAKLEQVGNKNSALFTERLTKAIKDGQKLGCEVVQGLMSECVKRAIVNFERLNEEKAAPEVEMAEEAKAAGQ